MHDDVDAGAARPVLGSRGRGHDDGRRGGAGAERGQPAASGRAGRHPSRSTVAVSPLASASATCASAAACRGGQRDPARRPAAPGLPRQPQQRAGRRPRVALRGRPAVRTGPCGRRSSGTSAADEPRPPGGGRVISRVGDFDVRRVPRAARDRPLADGAFVLHGRASRGVRIPRDRLVAVGQVVTTQAQANALPRKAGAQPSPGRCSRTGARRASRDRYRERVFDAVSAAAAPTAAPSTCGAATTSARARARAVRAHHRRRAPRRGRARAPAAIGADEGAAERRARRRGRSGTASRSTRLRRRASGSARPPDAAPTTRLRTERAGRGADGCTIERRARAACFGPGWRRGAHRRPSRALRARPTMPLELAAASTVTLAAIGEHPAAAAPS